MTNINALLKPTGNDERTIAILGGGPAGTSTALSFLQSLATQSPENEPARRYHVHLFDCPRSSNIRVGETIPPAATPVLRQLGVQDIVEAGDIHLDCPGSISLWNSEKPGHNDFLLDIVGRGYHLNRERFDAQLLAKACTAGVTYHNGWRLTGVNDVQGHKHLDFSVQKKNKSTIKADFVVDATGKAAAFSRRLNVCRNVFDDVIFLCTVIDIPEDCKILPHTLVESVSEGWWYAARLPDNKMIVTFCTDQESIKNHHWHTPARWFGLLQETKWLGKKLSLVLSTLSTDSLHIVTHSAPSSLLSAVCGENWLAVGDAASSYDPITSAGITKALQHGYQAGKALATRVIDGKQNALMAYQNRVFDDFGLYARVRNELYGSEKRFSNSPFWLRRLGK
ncbi:hypothetical protein A9Q81_21785 [Gammaproteobacteria bacterium 42_54_T18]|nr:hypothetical protein A9Q81_21785 [Gammaproteobacteria bacterium 42_54_T18]